MNPSTIEILATIFFACAIVHTFSARTFHVLAARYETGSVLANLFHILGEVEVVFGFWAGVLIITLTFHEGREGAVSYLDGLDFTEPLFVFVIMVIAATRPIIHLASSAIAGLARVVPVPNAFSFYVFALILGPLLGSFITEPAAMTVTALILKNRYYDRGISNRFAYATLGLLFVNVSIGGTLTHFAAPPVLMVAAKWNLGLGEMFQQFGWKAAVAVIVNTVAVALVFFKELSRLSRDDAEAERSGVTRAVVPWWLVVLHVGFLALVVATAHHAVIFVGVFLFFLGVARVTTPHQQELRLREGLLVAFFLSGLVVLGKLQGWWLEPVLKSLDTESLFLGTTALTGITDNAALTYLGSQVPDLSAASKFALLAGAVAGGGMTVIANAPNPAGYGILRSSFPGQAVSLFGLAAGALGPTLVAMACLWWLPSL